MPGNPGEQAPEQLTPTARAKDLMIEAVVLHPATVAMAEIKSSSEGFRRAAHAVLDNALNDLELAVEAFGDPQSVSTD